MPWQVPEWQCCFWNFSCGVRSVVYSQFWRFLWQIFHRRLSLKTPRGSQSGRAELARTSDLLSFIPPMSNRKHQGHHYRLSGNPNWKSSNFIWTDRKTDRQADRQTHFVASHIWAGSLNINSSLIHSERKQHIIHERTVLYRRRSFRFWNGPQDQEDIRELLSTVVAGRKGYLMSVTNSSKETNWCWKWPSISSSSTPWEFFMSGRLHLS